MKQYKRFKKWVEQGKYSLFVVLFFIIATVFLFKISNSYESSHLNLSKVVFPTIEPTSVPSSVSDESPILMIGGGGGEERIYLRPGTIFAYKNDSTKEYNIHVIATFHVAREDYKKMLFFKSPEEAESLGFKPSKDFARDYECWKTSKTDADFFKCHK